MDASVLGLAAAGAVLGFSAIGSAFGTGYAGMSAVGSWKKCYTQDKPAPFSLMIFVGAPMTQTLYGYILFRSIVALSEKMADAGAGIFENFTKDPFSLLMMGCMFAGFAIGASALFQGKVAAACADALAETGKGMAYYLMVVGVVETVALLVMVFMLITLGKF
ncbi:MAG: V-type ATP synthase subunit K [Deltaproteobacteria bacterium]|nr:V-type ATP synthase subunit K [Deltaproteobacteria bacterium]